MKKQTFFVYGALSLTLVAFGLTGCEKKQEGPKSEPAVAAPAPAAVAPSTANTPLPDDVLVRVGDWTLTTDQFNERLKLLKQGLPDFKEDDPNSRKAVLDELVRQQLLVKDAEDSGIGDLKEIKDAVSDFRKTLLVQELASRLTKEVGATEDDARTFYDANKERFMEPVTWSVSEIVAGDEATAKSILVQVLQGGDFAALAKAQSIGKTAAQGGVLKPFTAGHAPFAALQTASAALDEGGISGVFKGPEGYYIIKVDSKKGGKIKPFIDVKKDLVYGLTMQRQQEAILTHLNQLAQKYKVEVNKKLISQTENPAGPAAAGQ